MKSLNQNLVKITELLSDGQYHDGTSIGRQLGITRAAVWKLIKKLEHYGIPLNSLKGKGYRLESPLILINPDKIKNNLDNSSVHLDILEKVGSTNDYLKKFTIQNNKMRVCIVETQIQGKGRLGRQWYSPFGENIYLSILYPFERDVSELSGLSLVVGLAICQAIESIVDLKDTPLKMKWPNDILIDQKKLAGILIEVQAETNGVCQAIIGVGINVNMSNASEKDIGQPWSSLLKVTGQHQDRNILCAVLIGMVIDYLERFSSSSLPAFIEEWKTRDCLTNNTIAVISGNQRLEGVCIGVNEQGRLLLKTANQVIQACSSGDTTLLK